MRWLLVLAYLAGGAGALASVPESGARPASLSVLDVGQGDAIAIDAGLGVLVDTGNPGSQARALGTRVAALVITHLHEDHAGDAEAVIASRPAAAFWNGVAEGPLYDELREAAERHGVPLVALAPGDVLRAGGARLSVLAPALAYRTSGDPNDSSLVIRADLPGFSALLTGDAGAAAEGTLPAEEVDVDVLKVGHHGSKTATSEPFLAATTPELAIISSGEGNRYGHPSEDALGRLAEQGIPVLRTDLSGTVAVSARGGVLSVSTTSGR